MKLYRYNFHIDEEVLTRLKRLAYDERTTVSEIIRYAINEHLDGQRRRADQPADPAAHRS